MKMWLILAVILAMQPAKPEDAKGASQSKAAQSAEQPESAKSDGGNPQTPSVSVTVNNAPSSPNPQPKAEDFNENMRIQRRLALYTGLLVLVGFATAFVIGLQSVETGRAARAAKESAAAAQRSTEITARVSVPTLMLSEFKSGQSGAANLAAMLQYPRVALTLRNYGQTPAFLKWWTILFTCEELPDTPVYIGQPGCGISLEKAVIEPGGSYDLPEPNFLHRYMLSEQDIEAIMGQRAFLVAYGYVCYGDIFGNPLRRFKFCETALNVFEDTGTGPAIQWASDMGPHLYWGTDDVPVGQHVS